MRIIFIWALCGFFLGAAIAFSLGLLILSYGSVDQREGGAAMGVIFFFTPAGALLGTIIGTVAGILRRR